MCICRANIHRFYTIHIMYIYTYNMYIHIYYVYIHILSARTGTPACLHTEKSVLNLVNSNQKKVCNYYPFPIDLAQQTCFRLLC